MKLPKEPTTAAPGSAAKIEVLRQRYAAGEQLHHPDDSKAIVRPQEANWTRPRAVSDSVTVEARIALQLKLEALRAGVQK